VSRRLRFGVIGLGFGAYHVRTLATMDEVELVAVADRRSGIAESIAAQYRCNAYEDGIEMMRTELLDAVTLCTSPRHREEPIRFAAGNGIALFVEKPWASDSAHARRLADIVDEDSTPVMVGFSFRYHPAITRLRTLLDGELGPGRMLLGQYVFNWIPEPGNWLWDPQNGNGLINENACHLLDAVGYLMGKPVSVFAEGGNFSGSPSEDAAVMCLRFENGGIAALSCGGIAPGGFQRFPYIDLAAENGRAELIGHDHIWEQLRWSRAGDDHVQSYRAAPERLGETRYTDALRHFVDCLRRGETPSATVADGVRIVDVCMAVYESVRTGRRVQL